MKANMKNLLLEQTKIMLQELNEIEDVKDRLELRIEVAEFLVSFSSVSDVEINEGKDAIKENKAKPIIVEEDDEEPVEDVVDEPVEAVSIEEVIDAGENLAPEVAAQAADELESEPVIEEEQVEEVIEENVQETQEDKSKKKIYKPFVKANKNNKKKNNKHEHKK